MVAAAILKFSEVKFDVTVTSRPNLVKIAQRAAELWQLMCVQKYNLEVFLFPGRRF